MNEYDIEFYETVYDAEGNPQTVLKLQMSKKTDNSSFTTYDTSHGHCGNCRLCGSLSCNGGCFK